MTIKLGINDKHGSVFQSSIMNLKNSNMSFKGII